jgi:hypothetical protein
MNSEFPIFGRVVPPMIGRTSIMNRLKNGLIKDIPNHISIVGPKSSGKSVVVHALAKYMREEKDSPFNAVVLWKTDDPSPNDNDDFWLTMCKKIGSELESIDKEYADFLSNSSSPFNDIKDILEILEGKKIKLLMIWDGFDKPLGNEKLTKNLWDNLREVAQSASITVVTTTRKPLRELIRSEESITSKLWNLFDQHDLELETFNEDDRSDVLSQLENIEFTKGAKTELVNWTGGFPPLYLSLINILQSHSRVDTVEVNEAAKKYFDGGALSVLEELWKDVPGTEKELFCEVAEHIEIKKSDYARHLSLKGLVGVSKNKIFLNCRLMKLYVEGPIKENIGSISRLFKERDHYEKNIKLVLEHRLNQITNIDTRMKNKIMTCIRDNLPTYPESCCKDMRDILDRFFNLIFDIEFSSERIVPIEWIDTWEKERGKKIKITKPFPVKDGEKMQLLENMTGAYHGQESPPRARAIHKASYYFLNTIKTFGDYGQHFEGEKVPLGAAISSIFACIELAESIYNK